MWLKSSTFSVVENTYFDPFLPGHPNWSAPKAYTKPSECIHTVICVYVSILKYMKGCYQNESDLCILYMFIYLYSSSKEAVLKVFIIFLHCSTGNDSR